MAWYSGNQYERFMMLEPHDRARTGWSYWALILCNVARPAAPLVRAGPRRTWSCCSSLSIVVNVGMWLERFVIIVTSLHRDFLPSSWGMYHADDLGLVDATSARSGCS